MKNKSNVLAIIPARSGSKGIKDKNILKINNINLIEYAILEAKKSNVFKRICLSSDSENYGVYAHKHKIDFHKRSKEISGDKSDIYDTIFSVLDYYKKKNIKFDYFMLLQPTSPFRNYTHIQNAYNLLIDSSVDSVISVNKSNIDLRLINKLPDNHSMKNFIKIDKYFRRQDNEMYTLNGAIYLINTEIYLNDKNFYKCDSKAYIMDDLSSLDIDTFLDYKFACFLMENKNEINNNI